MKPSRFNGVLFLSWCMVLCACVGESRSEWKRITPVVRGDQMPATSDVDPSKSVRAVRLIFEYEGDRVRLVAQHPVEVAGANVESATNEQVGFFVDSRDKSNLTLARVPARHAFSSSVEVFPERHDEPITRTDVAQPKGAFTVVLPAPDETDHVTIVRIAVTGAAGRVGVRAAAPEVSDLVSFPLERNR
jgi:hypothetical protein